jgi:hypothetical protein
MEVTSCVDRIEVGKKENTLSKPSQAVTPTMKMSAGVNSVRVLYLRVMDNMLL